MFGSNDQKSKQDNVPVIGPVTDEVVSDDAASQNLPFDPSTVSLPTPSAPAAPAPAQETERHQDAPSPAPTINQPQPGGHHDDQLSSHDVNDNLVHIKQEALQQLSPLVDHLEQSPEEKFRTTMMMIQASDDQSLVKDAYEAAKAIKDDKVRAQALLDIVNEINYFTQQAKHQAH